MVRYILITGGVISGVGKGVIASSTGLLLRKVGYKVTAIKIDPYLNIDAGTMSPFEHGEVFILDDGGEVDLDLGNYERFMDVTLSRENNITTGKIYQKVIQREREGYYLGKTVQVVPHICDAIQEWIEDVAKRPTSNSPPSSPRSGSEPDICIIELGGTIGDIESMPFVEAMRQFQFRVGKENFIEMHVSLVPVVGTSGEQKTKPTQSSVRELRSLGLSPDVIICRSTAPLEEEVTKKIAQFCHVHEGNVIAVHNVPNLYHVPLLLNQQKLCEKILKHFQLPAPSPPVDVQIDSWKRDLAEKMDMLLNSKEESVKIAMVGKYTGLSDSYLSVIKSVTHSSLQLTLKTELVWIESTDLEESNPNKDSHKLAWEKLKTAHGIIVPGGFGNRGVEGMILCCKYARENKIPFFGICLGFQVAVIEICRNVLGWSDANSEEFDENAGKKAIVFMPEGSRTVMGATMRLGSRISIFNDKTSKAYELYGRKDTIEERHRHRYEVNPELVETIETTGLQFVAQDESKQRMEIFELKDHPYYVGTQAHPEMKSRPGRPSPLFLGLVQAAGEYFKSTF